MTTDQVIWELERIMPNDTFSSIVAAVSGEHNLSKGATIHRAKEQLQESRKKSLSPFSLNYNSQTKNGKREWRLLIFQDDNIQVAIRWYEL